MPGSLKRRGGRAVLIGVALALAVVVGGCAAPERPRNRAAQTPSVPVTSILEPSPTPTIPEPTPRPTATRPPAAATFAVIGDFGSGTDTQRAVARRMCEWRKAHPFDVVVTTGDNVYNTGNPDLFGPRFYQPMRCLLRRGVQFHASLGNHDYVTRQGRPEMNERAFGMGGRRNYVVRNNGVRLVVWDSNVGNVEWLRRATKARAGDRWTVVAFHHPIWSSGVHGSTEAYKPELPRLFRRRDVDLVLNGHDHNFEATRELRGIRYVVTGGGGAEVRACGRSWFTDGSCVARHHFVYVEAGSEEIDVRAVPISGRPFHRFTTSGR